MSAGDPGKGQGPGDSNAHRATRREAPDSPPGASSAQAAAVRAATTARRVTAALGTRINALSFLPKWLILATVIGIIAGCGAIVFYEALQLATHFFLGVLAGYFPPRPAGEGGGAGTGHFTRPWAIPLVLILGGLLAGFIVFTWAPEAEGHGTDAAIDAVHNNPRGIRLRAVVVKIVASALTIGSGGSGGREGPTAQISAGFGSLLARVLDLSPEDGRIAVSVGIGSGIGAIFSAPLGGAVLAADIVYSDDFEYEALLPALWASIVAYAIFGGVFGYRPLFAIPGYHFTDPLQLLWFALVGLLAGGIGLLYSKVFYGVAALSRRLPFTRKLRPALGAALVGLLALWLPEVLGTGYGWVQQSLSGDLLHVPLYIVLLLPFARIVATSLSISTGGSGGVFGPGMVTGAFTGLAVWRLLEPVAPAVGHDPAPFVVVGMMAVFGGISRAPVAVMLMVAQMTGNISLVAPAMIAVAVSWFVVKRADDSIYRSQLHTRADAPYRRLASGLPRLSAIAVAQAMTRPQFVVSREMPAGHALAELARAGLPGAPVVDAGGSYLGTVEASRLSARPARDKATAGQLADVTTPTVTASASLDVGLAALLDAGGQWLPVTGPGRRIAGILSIGDLVREYARQAQASPGRFQEVTRQSVAVEETLGRESPLSGRAIGDGTLPAGSVVIAVQRGAQSVAVSATTVLRPGDVLSLFASAHTVPGLAALIRGKPAPPPEAAGKNQLI